MSRAYRALKTAQLFPVKIIYREFPVLKSTSQDYLGMLVNILRELLLFLQTVPVITRNFERSPPSLPFFAIVVIF